MKKFFLFSFLLIFCFFLFHPVALAKTLEFSPNVSLGSFKVGQSVAVPGDFSLLKKYIIAVYKFIIGLSAILAVIVIAIGGFLWITAAGSAGQVSKAKGLITGSLFGLVLTLLSYSLLQAVNPDITNLDFQGAKIKDINNEAAKGCKWQNKCEPYQIDRTSDGSLYCSIDGNANGNKHCCCENVLVVKKICPSNLGILCGAVDFRHHCIGSYCDSSAFNFHVLCQLYKNDKGEYVAGQCMDNSIPVQDLAGNDLVSGTTDKGVDCGMAHLKASITWYFKYKGFNLWLGTSCPEGKTCVLVGNKAILDIKNYKESPIWSSIKTFADFRGVDVTNIHCQ